MDGMVLENDFVRYTIDSGGRSIGFVDKRTGRDYCAKDPPQPFAIIRKDGKNFEPSRCSYVSGRLVFSFPEANITVAVRATEKGPISLLRSSPLKAGRSRKSCSAQQGLGWQGM